jgi:hypothetical protein
MRDRSPASESEGENERSSQWLAPGESLILRALSKVDAKENAAGTFWFQPGGPTGSHGDECASDSCTVFIFMPGKFDFTPAAEAKAPPARMPSTKK